MNPIERIAAFVAQHDQRPPASVSGRWHNIQIKPDLGSGEVLNVGVAFVDDAARVHLKMARDLSRLACLYDERIDVRSFERLSALIEDAYSGVNLADFTLSALSGHAHISEGRFASGASINEILSQFYETTVPLGRPAVTPISQRGVRAKSVSTSTAQERVVKRLLERMGQRAVPFVARGPWIVVEPDGREHRIEVPIRAAGRLCASVVSVWSKNEYQRKFQLAKGGLDLDTVQAQAPGERLGLFVMRPMDEEGYSKAELDQIDLEIDEVAWQLRKTANIEVEQGEDAEDLSEKLEQWLEAA